MTADYGISCDSSKYKFGVIWASVMILIYPIGFPLYFFYLLYDIRNDIISILTTPTPIHKIPINNQQKLRSLHFFYSAYKSSFWWWEIMETFQRIMLTGVLVLIEQGSEIQIIVGGLLTLFFLYLYARYEPFQDQFILSIKILSYWQLLFVFWISLLIKVEINSLSNSLLGGLLFLVIFANILNDIFNICWIILSSWSIFQKINQFFESYEIELRPTVVHHQNLQNEKSVNDLIDENGKDTKILVSSPFHEL